MKKNYLLLTFFTRTWPFLVFAILAVYVVTTNHTFSSLGQYQYDEPKGEWFWQKRTIFDVFGGLAFIPSLTSLVMWFTLLYRHLIYRETIDKDIHDGTYLKDWRACSPYERIKTSNFVFIGILIALCILCAGLARGSEPVKVDQVARWNTATINPKYSIALDMAVKCYQRNAARYQKIQAMREGGVPAPILFCLHMRESDNDFRCHAHEGSPLLHRTRDEPKGRLPHPEPPYTFEQSAEDAYYVCEHPTLDKIDWTNMQAALDKMESFNGFGYRARGIAAPYLYSGTSLYKSGKYVADHKFDRLAIDQQLGCVAVLKRMQQRGIAISFASFDTNKK